MKKFISEFKEFITRGNVMDMAVGIIIGGAFTAIVNSLVEHIIMPVISLITGGLDFNAWQIVIGSGENPATIMIGSFIAAVINFILVALVIFLLISTINKMRRKKEENTEPTTKICPYCQSEISIQATRCPNCTSQLSE